MLSTTPDRTLEIQQARQHWLTAPAAGAVRAGLDAWLLDSWTRCVEQGHDPSTRIEFKPLAPGDTQASLERNQPLIQAARPVMSRLVDAIADTRYFAVVTDLQGTVIESHGPCIAHDKRARDLARLGVDLSEQAVGTTAIAGALHERKPVWLHQGEHFFQSNTIFSCAGAPLIGPHGQCVGMLDLTGIQTPERKELKHLVARSARQIENALTLATTHQLLVRLNWPGETLGYESDGLLALCEDGLIVGANTAARDMLGHTLSALASHKTHVSEVLATPHQHLFDWAGTETNHSVPTWNGLHLAMRCQRLRSPLGPRPGERTPLRTLESAVIRQAVDEAKGNVTLAAQRLGIGRATVYRRLQAKKA
jgi:sigma-54 dependent transcriptional regulator, acetoin dehydrogenase operon transcriptional activator AcoR